MVLYESPIVFLIALNAFRLMDPSLEEQSIACGNTVMGTLRRVTLPVLRPLILSSFLLVFVIGLINAGGADPHRRARRHLRLHLGLLQHHRLGSTSR